ncbi:dTDP-4-dehydrorhamnose 3,5-epimerase [Nocardioides mangrovicus]|uniref:dTDP-4-dehydrorhamnose 3,5-epimerase n=1 Tax=Nocardioides mangrovicus TaxID=2478913 RepID=A0A3L8P114_9ACTN|nr:dTDP-4-dehydrorhamnose 3,5-epimerase [Nocardioides mangrovicus]RLV48617.1 dTDP-4-dehydrorhamnose 3,5-epimerase [Nocardioides mangrovicus]
MRVETTALAGLLVLVPDVRHDERGFFTRTFEVDLARAHGLDPDAFVQDSQSRSRQGVVRGLHGRGGAGEAKLVRCANGAVHDVVVDIRPGSATFGRWLATRLDDVEHRHLYIPAGFLHGHQTLTPTADVCYRIDREHNQAEDLAVRYDDPDLGVEWPAPVTVVSDRDAHAPSWQHLQHLLASDQ